MVKGNTTYSLLIQDSPTEVLDLADGKRFLKQIVKFGKWVDPHNRSNKMNLDRAWAEKVAANFKNKTVGRIPVPMGHPSNPADLALMNKGELVNLEVRDDGLYGELDIRDQAAAKSIEDDLVWDVSVSFDPNYLDKKAGKEVGPALLHVGLLTDPYLKGMAPFQALGNNANAVMLSESKEYNMSVVKNDKEFDVTVKYTEDGVEKETVITPGQEVEVPDEAVEAAQKQVTDAQAPEAATQAEGDKKPGSPARSPEASAPATPTATPELSDREKELEKQLSDAHAQLAQRDAESTYSTLLSDGRIVPAQHDAFIALATAPATTVSLSDGTTKSLNDLLTELIKAGPKKVNFGEEGADGDEKPKTPYEELSDEEKEGLRLTQVSPEDYNKVNGDQSNNKKEA